jgi:hypothetical protein
MEESTLRKFLDLPPLWPLDALTLRILQRTVNEELYILQKFKAVAALQSSHTSQFHTHKKRTSTTTAKQPRRDPPRSRPDHHKQLRHSPARNPQPPSPQHTYAAYHYHRKQAQVPQPTPPLSDDPQFHFFHQSQSHLFPGSRSHDAAHSRPAREEMRAIFPLRAASHSHSHSSPHLQRSQERGAQPSACQAATKADQREDTTANEGLDVEDAVDELDEGLVANLYENVPAEMEADEEEVEGARAETVPQLEDSVSKANATRRSTEVRGEEGDTVGSERMEAYAAQHLAALRDKHVREEDYRRISAHAFPQRALNFTKAHFKMLTALYSGDHEPSIQKLVGETEAFLEQHVKIIHAKLNVEQASSISERGYVVASAVSAVSSVSNITAHPKRKRRFLTMPFLPSTEEKRELFIDAPSIIAKVLHERYARLRRVLNHYSEPYLPLLVLINEELLGLYRKLYSTLNKTPKLDHSLWSYNVSNCFSADDIFERASNESLLAELKHKILLWRLFYATLSASCLS